MPSRAPVGFIEPMLLQHTERLPSDGGRWAYELKLDGYRAIAANTGAGVRLWSRNANDFTKRYAAIARALAKLPSHTVIDGEVVALDGEGRPSFNALQNADPKAPLRSCSTCWCPRSRRDGNPSRNDGPCSSATCSRPSRSPCATPEN